MFLTFNSIQKLVIAIVSLCIFSLVLVFGSWAGLQISKRQFETEAQNIVAVLRSGMSVVDGLATSLDASNYSATYRGQEHLNVHLTKVLGNYDYVVSLGRFESIPGSELRAFEGLLAASETDAETMWRYNDSTVTPIKNSSRLREHYPLSVVKTRLYSDSQVSDLTGFDLASYPRARAIIQKPGAEGRSVVTPVPASWKRPEHLMMLRTSVRNEVLNGGYLLEVNVEKMASSGGVSLSDFGLSLSMFSEQGEFESSSMVDVLYKREGQAQTGDLLSTRFDNNRWLSSFDVGDKTLILEVNRATGLSAKFAVATLFMATLLPLMFLMIVHLNGKRRQAQKLQRIESEKLYHARHRASVTLASIGDGVITTDKKDNILYANSAAEQLLGYSSEQMQGKTIDEVVVTRSGRSSDKQKEDEGLTLLSADGSSIHVNIKESDLEDSDGKHSGKVVVLRDVSTERSLTLALQHRVNHDSLTGLSNRFNFEQKIDEIFLESRVESVGYGMCFIDLDRFKEVNDTCGHGAGDELLMRIAAAFKKNVREEDLVARLGGDEFGIILHQCAAADAMIVAERIREYFQSFYFEYGEHTFPVRCSIGLVHFDPAESNRDEVMKSADAACYDAKNKGRNSICERVMGEDSSKNSADTVTWLPRIKDALENEKFTLHVQSIAALSDGSVSSHEILLRMVADDGSLISPIAFMKTAIRYELALDIDRWVVNRALAKISGLPSRYSSDKFAINLSVHAISSPEFLEFLNRQIILSGIDASRLCFDIKESDVLHNPTAAAEFCQSLHDMGCLVALDDFGASMTSFSALKTLPVSVLKIDGSLIANLNGATSSDAVPNADYALVKSIYSFASSMGLTTIAEQVEDYACLDVLKTMKVGYGQGVAIARPVPFEECFADRGGSIQRAA